jgi:hypothetical protein
MRTTYQTEFERLQEENTDLKERMRSLEEENKEHLSELTRARKRREAMEEQNKDLAFDNIYLQEEFKNILEENLAIYLQIGDKSKRGWIKKMYKNIAQAPNNSKSQLQTLYQEQVVTTIDGRNQLEQITGDLVETITRKDIEIIG